MLMRIFLFLDAHVLWIVVGLLGLIAFNLEFVMGPLVGAVLRKLNDIHEEMKTK